MTAAQCELVCRREGLALAHLGRARLVLVHTSAPAQTMLRIGVNLRPVPPDSRALARSIFDELMSSRRKPDPEAA